MPLVALLAVLVGFGWLIARGAAPKPRDRQAEIPADRATGREAHRPPVVPVPTSSAEPESSARDRATRLPTVRSLGATTLAEAMAESQEDGKPVLIDFNADWCGPCQALKHEVLDDAERAVIVQHLVIPVSIVDRVREDGQNSPETDELQRRFGVEAFPTLVVFSARSGRSMVVEGYGGPEHTLEWIEAASLAVR